jgi:hypothetical protein
VEAAPNPAPRSLWRHGVRAGEAKVAGRGADVSRPDRSLLRCRRGTRDSHPPGSFGYLGWCSEERRRCGACAVLFDRFSVRRGATGKHASEADVAIASVVWRRWSWVASRVGSSRFVVGLRLAEVLASGASQRDLRPLWRFGVDGRESRAANAGCRNRSERLSG